MTRAPAGVSLFNLDGTVTLLPNGEVRSSGGGGPPSGPASGDLSGNYPAPTVDGLQNRPVSSAAPALNDVLLWDGANWEPGATPGGPPTGAAGGDLAGSYPNPTVDALQTVSVSAVAPTLNQVLTYNGAAWAPATPAASLPPSGAAGGDLDGSYPNPQVDGLRGVTVSAVAPTLNQVLAYNGTVWIPTTPPASLPPSGAAGGDLDGTYPNPQVDGLRGVTVSATAPTLNQVLAYNGAVWIPTTLAAATGVVPATPSTILTRTATGGARANQLTADTGDLGIGHTTTTPAAPGAGGDIVMAGQDANTTGAGGDLVWTGGDAASGDASPQRGGSALFQVGSSAGSDPAGGMFEIRNAAGDLIYRGGQTQTGSAGQQSIFGGNLLPESDQDASIGLSSLRWDQVHAAAITAHADAANNVKGDLGPTSLAFTSTSGGARGPATITARDTLHNGQLRGEIQTVTFASPTTTIDLDLGLIHRLTLTGDTAIAWSNLRTGGYWILELIQDGTGSRVVTWGGGEVWPNGVAPVLSRSAGARDSFLFYREDGGGADPVCVAFSIQDGYALGYQPANGGATLSGGFTYAARALDYIRADATGGTGVVNLPNSTGLSKNHAITIKEVGGSDAGITVNAAATTTIDGNAAVVLDVEYGGLTLIPDGSGGWDAFPPAVPA